MDRNLVSHSKFLSLVLRHSPEKIGIDLDAAGWTSVEKLIEAASTSGRDLDYDTIVRIVHENDKQRFTFSNDGKKIRANQGHSVNIELGLKAELPPAQLYHGTVEKNIQSIRGQGLLPGARNHVHLSSDTKTANIVGSRRGKPIVLIVNAKEMADSGYDFFLSANGVWLTKSVPSTFIVFPSLHSNRTTETA